MAGGRLMTRLKSLGRHASGLLTEDGQPPSDSPVCVEEVDESPNDDPEYMEHFGDRTSGEGATSPKGRRRSTGAVLKSVLSGGRRPTTTPVPMPDPQLHRMDTSHSSQLQGSQITILGRSARGSRSFMLNPSPLSGQQASSLSPTTPRQPAPGDSEGSHSVRQGLQNGGATDASHGSHASDQLPFDISTHTAAPEGDAPVPPSPKEAYLSNRREHLSIRFDSGGRASGLEVFPHPFTEQESLPFPQGPQEAGEAGSVGSHPFRRIQSDLISPSLRNGGTSPKATRGFVTAQTMPRASLRTSESGSGLYSLAAPAARQGSPMGSDTSMGSSVFSRRLSRKITASNKLVVSTEKLQAGPGEIVLPEQVGYFAQESLGGPSGRCSLEIQFSGKSARVLRNLARPVAVEG